MSPTGVFHRSHRSVVRNTARDAATLGGIAGASRSDAFARPSGPRLDHLPDPGLPGAAMGLLTIKASLHVSRHRSSVLATLRSIQIFDREDCGFSGSEQSSLREIYPIPLVRAEP